MRAYLLLGMHLKVDKKESHMSRMQKIDPLFWILKYYVSAYQLEDLLADNLIGELQVYCSNKKSLCKW